MRSTRSSRSLEYKNSMTILIKSEVFFRMSRVPVERDTNYDPFYTSLSTG